MICNDNHRSAPSLSTLDNDQSNPDGRHKCPGCALIAGFNDGFSGIQMRFEQIKDYLNDSQAQMGRHKNARQAYEKGYILGNNARYSI